MRKSDTSLAARLRSLLMMSVASSSARTNDSACVGFFWIPAAVHINEHALLVADGNGLTGARPPATEQLKPVIYVARVGAAPVDPCSVSRTIR